MFNRIGIHRHRRGQMFERGAIKYLILDLIRSKPRHGYDIIRELEESSGGCYSPSPGTIYPSLQMLEDLGHVRVKEENGKKVYEITDEGRDYLSAHKESVILHRERMAECFGPKGSTELGSVMREMKGLFQIIAHSARQGIRDPEKIERIKRVLAQARKEIEQAIEG